MYLHLIQGDWFDGIEKIKDGWTSNIKFSAIVGIAHQNPFEVVTRNCGEFEHGTRKE